jgi:hypothetical protein
MAGRGLHIFQTGTMVERRGHARRPHGMHRVSPTPPKVPCLLPTYTVNDIRVSMPASVQPLALVSHRPDEWPLAILPMPCQRQGIVEALGGLLVPPSVLMRCGLGWWAPSSCTSVHCTACSSANTMYACLHHHLSWEAGHRPQALGNGAHRWDEQKSGRRSARHPPPPRRRPGL